MDDGYTGTNFNRPGFQKLLDDIENGYVSVIIVKDMSRLGRDYLQVGYYTDTYFPEHNIRFIAVNDCVDSADGENELLYCADCGSKLWFHVNTINHIRFFSCSNYKSDYRGTCPKLCTEHERRGFIEGIRWGMQIAAETGAGDLYL